MAKKTTRKAAASKAARKPPSRARPAGGNKRSRKAAAASRYKKEEYEDAVRRFNAKWSNSLPPRAVSTGHFEPNREDDPYRNEQVRAPNGIYRVEGADWLLTIKGEVFIEAAKAVPPDYGGKGVVSIPADNAGPMPALANA